MLNYHSTMPKSAPYSGTQAVRRAVGLLKTFSEARPELSLAELVAASGLNKTTAFRLLSALAAEGLVARSEEGAAWRLGPEAIALGTRALRSSDLRAVSRPFLEELARRSGETATIETLVGADVLILGEARSRESLLGAPSVGTRWPAHATSTGKVLLAELPEPARRSLLRAPLARPARRTIAALVALRRELAQVRSQGYATALGELEDGYNAIGVPVRDHDGRVTAAVSIGGPSARLSLERLRDRLPPLRRAAARISRRLGFAG